MILFYCYLPEDKTGSRITKAIKEVLYVPDAKFNLVSVDCITKSTHFEVLFGKTD